MVSTLALVMLGPVAAAAIAIALIVPAQARAAAQETAAHDVSSAALVLVTRCQAIKDAAVAFARQVGDYANFYPELPPAAAVAAAEAAAARRPGATAAVLGPDGQVLAFAGAPSGELAVKSSGYGSSCSTGTAGRRPDQAALAETVPVSTHRGSEAESVGSVVLWETVDDARLRHLVIDIGSTGSLRVLPPSSHHRTRYVADGQAYASQPARPGMPFTLQAVQPVRNLVIGGWFTAALLLAVLLALLLALLLAVLVTRIIAGRALDDMATQLQITKEKHEEAQRLSVTDALTGAGNLRRLSGTMTHEVERATRFGRPFTVLMLDLDHFKDVNDSLGHQFGDAVLREFAQRLRTCLRELDTVARYGGEEFVLVLPETGLDGGCSAADRVMDAVRGAPFGLNGVERSVTVSIGIASFPVHARSAADLLRCADRALYAAKSAGRDRWMVAAMSAGPAVSVPQAR